MNCSICGFEASSWLRRDVADFFGGLGYWWRVGPGLSVPGACEWAAKRTSEVLVAVSDQPGTTSVEANGQALSDVVRSLPSGPSPELLDLAHELSHQMMEVARKLRPAIGGGRVDQVNVSPGGVPKRPVPAAAVSFAGVSGDKQSDRKHHGRRFQAVCLWSAEVIAGLAADGHPIFPGAAGENLTVSGLDWTQVRPGVRLAVGEELEVEVSWPATPCRHQAQWFSDGDFGRIHEDRAIDLARWYAWVRVPGPAAVGATVRLPSAG